MATKENKPYKKDQNTQTTYTDKSKQQQQKNVVDSTTSTKFGQKPQQQQPKKPFGDTYHQ